MKRRAAIISLCLFSVSAQVAAEIRMVKAVEFRGLRYLSKYEVIRGVRKKVQKGGIVIDFDSLEHVLSSNSFIEDFNISSRDDRIVITVVEKKPFLIVAVQGKRRAVLFELDMHFSVISQNIIHANDLPVLVVPEIEMEKEDLTGRVWRVMNLIRKLGTINEALYHEISEIYIKDEILRVYLRNRRTEYLLRPSLSSFARLNYIVGYYDRKGQSPRQINLSSSVIIAR